jgi:hypothetical protein
MRKAILANLRTATSEMTTLACTESTAKDAPERRSGLHYLLADICLTQGEALQRGSKASPETVNSA